jgi:hypothetical protein
MIGGGNGDANVPVLLSQPTILMTQEETEHPLVSLS